MSVISRSMSLAIVFGLALSGCAADDREGREPSSEPDQASSSAYSCGVSPSSITYWSSQWARDVIVEDGIIGGCEFDSSCVPTCFGETSEWTSWSGPLIECPCR